ncbi:ester cyclase [Occallatibacter savannae]|uniref:ester cyclase n=1 Tax=Occallatibacter savannae TaxID=1002691 RepID=UPI000D688070|nr:nuclear transport factor 2 family protein [Occallatibacter savannae]
MQAKEIVQRYVDAFNEGDVDKLCGMFAQDAEIWGVLGWGTPEQVKPIWKDLIECLEINLKVEQMIQEGGTVAVRYTERGRSVKNFRGLGPTGKTYEMTAMEWFEVEDGMIRRRWGARDSATQSRQLGFSE